MANKRYDQFTQATPTGTRITLHADDTTGELKKCTLADILALQPPINTQVAALRKMGSSMINTTLTFADIHTYSYKPLYERGAIFQAIYLPACTVSSIGYVLGTAGVFTGNNFNGFGLYSLSGTTITNIGLTANDPTIFKAAATFQQSAALTSPVTVTAGIYYIGVLWCSSATTTTPTLAGQLTSGSPADFAFLTSPTKYVTVYKNPTTVLTGTFNVGSGAAATNTAYQMIPLE